jgi:hypothetical protein
LRGADHLSLHEIAVHAGLDEQLLVGALLLDAATVDDDDLVRLLDRTQAMGDENHGTTLEITVDGLLDDVLALGVESRGGLVEQKNNRPTNKGTGDCDSLLLTA